MLFYIFIYLAILITFYIEKEKGKIIISRKGTHLVTCGALEVSCFIIFLMMGLRATSVGQDLESYYRYMPRIWNDSWQTVLKECKSYYEIGYSNYANFEPGFILFCKLIGSISKSDQMFIIGTSAVVVVGYYYFIKVNSDDQLLSVLVLMALPQFITILSAVRQGMAISILGIAFSHLKKKDYCRFIIWCILASLFHYTAIFAIAVLPFALFKINKRKRIIIGIAALLMVFILKKEIFEILIVIIKPDNTTLRYNNSINLFIVCSIIYIICTLLCGEKDAENVFWCDLLWTASILQSMSSLHNLVGRMTWYFILATVVAVPNIYTKYVKNSPNDIKTISVKCLFIACGLYMTIRNTMVAMVPYVPFWRG